MKLKKEPLPDRLLRGDWPQTRDGKKWSKASSSFQRACFYAKKLCDLGMTPDQVTDMLTDLYWDAHSMFTTKQVKPKGAGPKPEKPYFDEFGIMFRVDITDITPEVLARDYEFSGNIVIEDEHVYRTLSGGGMTGGPLHAFLGILRLDNSYAFGPTRKQPGWTQEKLLQMEAVGIYKRKEQQKEVKKKATIKVAGRS